MDLFNSQIQYAILQTIIHSLWIGCLAWILGSLGLIVFKKSNYRYSALVAILLVYLISIVSVFAISFQTHTTDWLDVSLTQDIILDSDTIITDNTAEELKNAKPIIAIEVISKIVPILWVLGTIVFMLLYVKQIFNLRFIKQSKVTASDFIIEILNGITIKYNYTKPVRLYLSEHVLQPMMTGWIKPIIFLPIQIQTQLTREQIEVIVAHELMHIKRNDFVIKMVQNLTQTLLYYHPVTWWLTKIIDNERECSCDDVMLNSNEDPLIIAESLLAFKRLQGNTQNTLAFGNKQNTFHRIQRLFGQNPELLINKNYIVMTLTTLVLTAAILFSIKINSQSKLEQKQQESNVVGIEDCRISEGVKTKNGKKVYATKNVFTYDDEGREKKWYLYFDNGDLYYANESVYDSDGKRIKYLHYDSNDELVSYYKFEYDENGFEQRMSHYNLNDTLNETWEYTTDASGRIITETKKRANGSVKSIWKRKYDDRGNLIRKDIYTPNNELLSYMVMAFNDKNQKESMKWFNADNKEAYTINWKYQCTN